MTTLEFTCSGKPSFRVETGGGEWSTYWRVLFIAGYKMVQDIWSKVNKVKETELELQDESRRPSSKRSKRKRKAVALEKLEQDHEEAGVSKKTMLKRIKLFCPPALKIVDNQPRLLSLKHLETPRAAELLAPAGLDALHDMQLANGVYGPELVSKISTMLQVLAKYYPVSKQHLEETPYSPDEVQNFDESKTIRKINKDFKRAANGGFSCRVV